MRGAIGAAAIVACVFAGPASAGRDEPRETRGRYLVERVGICQDCHSPRDERGTFLRDRWLGGAPITFKPVAPMPWAEMAPPIAGLPTMSHAQAVHFLMSGERPDGTQARPPHPEYRLNPEDAEAVVAYLESLAPTE
jgi:mono/diheme cytochrome c family protein